MLISSHCVVFLHAYKPQSKNQNGVMLNSVEDKSGRRHKQKEVPQLRAASIPMGAPGGKSVDCSFDRWSYTLYNIEALATQGAEVIIQHTLDGLQWVIVSITQLCAVSGQRRLKNRVRKYPHNFGRIALLRWEQLSINDT